MSTRDLAHAYTRIADDYDRLVAGDAWMRKILWSRYLDLFPPKSHLLDIGCGTGTDALFLASQNRRITGIDISPGMIDQLQTKIDQANLSGRVAAHMLSHAELGVLQTEHFDGIISAFGGLNTVEDLSRFAADAARLLQPGNHLVVHMLNRFSLYECTMHLMDGHLGDAVRLRKKDTRTITIGGKDILHHLFYPRKTYRRFFKKHFKLKAAYGLGILRPPRNMELVAPQMAERLGRIEHQIRTTWPFRNWGRFFILELTRRPNK